MGNMDMEEVDNINMDLNIMVNNRVHLNTPQDNSNYNH